VWAGLGKFNLNLLEYILSTIFKDLGEFLLLLLNQITKRLILQFCAFNENAAEFGHIIKLRLQSIQFHLIFSIKLFQLLVLKFFGYSLSK